MTPPTRVPSSWSPPGRGHGRRGGQGRQGRLVAGVVGVVAAVALSACTGVTYAETPLPTPQVTTTTPAPAGTPVTCDNATQSYDPLPSIPASSAITDRSVRAILERGHLVVGVSADTYLFGARDPFTSRIEGFDIDIARAVAKSLLGSESKLRLRVITAADRLQVLADREVDMVARNMTMTCARWQEIAFSAEYYHSGQKLLVAKDPGGAVPDTGLEDLEGKRVCAPRGTSTLEKLRTVSGVEAVPAVDHTGCLVLFQQGKADAITGDDTVLAGLAAQDPYTVVSSAPAITDEPYGLGFNKEDVYLTRYVNRLLADMKADGRWKAIYNRWLAEPLGPAPAPPAGVHGRDA
ncbi:glutamate ABC transporter substrate-binding protein [Intrasporangium sp.]|uniref:glutamate ABC transporter substrate-binding protein n=1 Tax=Intrasporangium sp. TaxID=1925024 RepID=UPI00293A3E09|nr:glutamate ABC transporter substrate-binding protein [Intrasporangium sp.]MDV3220483.1 glutamate ABC transporter substrate-binding protein [Intrasporangium sp.]